MALGCEEKTYLIVEWKRGGMTLPMNLFYVLMPFGVLFGECDFDHVTGLFNFSHVFDHLPSVTSKCYHHHLHRILMSLYACTQPPPPVSHDTWHIGYDHFWLDVTSGLPLSFNASQGTIVDQESPLLHDIQHANTTNGQEWVRFSFFWLLSADYYIV